MQQCYFLKSQCLSFFFSILSKPVCELEKKRWRVTRSSKRISVEEKQCENDDNYCLLKQNISFVYMLLTALKEILWTRRNLNFASLSILKFGRQKIIFQKSRFDDLLFFYVPSTIHYDAGKKWWFGFLFSFWQTKVVWHINWIYIFVPMKTQKKPKQLNDRDGKRFRGSLHKTYGSRLIYATALSSLLMLLWREFIEPFEKYNILFVVMFCLDSRGIFGYLLFLCFYLAIHSVSASLSPQVDDK